MEVMFHVALRLGTVNSFIYWLINASKFRCQVGGTAISGFRTQWEKSAGSQTTDINWVLRV